MQRIRVKVCGTTRLVDALAAVRYGVDALGFIFAAKSPRYVTFEKAAAIISELPPLVDRVGVFVDADEQDLVDAVQAGINCLQLHGRESVKTCERIRLLLPHCTIFKAFRVSVESTPEDFSRYNDVVDAFLLDTYVKGNEGGTGCCFDWRIIERLDLQRPVILAGGLTPDNVELALNTVPCGSVYAVDINSGVEDSPGIKNHQLLEQLFRKIHNRAEH